MTRPLIVAACALALGLGAVDATATTLVIGTATASDPTYVGHVNNGVPSSIPNEASYINWLITLGVGAAPTQLPGTDTTDETYDRSYSTLVAVFPQAIVDGAVKVEETDPGFSHLSIDVTGFTYVLAKYDSHNPGAGSYVWYLAGHVTSIDLPATNERYGLSHYTLFNPVPDGGTTLMLLGCGLIGLGVLRRRLGA